VAAEARCASTASEDGFPWLLMAYIHTHEAVLQHATLSDAHCRDVTRNVTQCWRWSRKYIAISTRFAVR